MNRTTNWILNGTVTFTWFSVQKQEMYSDQLTNISKRKILQVGEIENKVGCE